LFMEYLLEFLTKRAPASKREQVLVDRVFYEKEYDRYVFRVKNLIGFMTITKQFRAYGIVEIQAKLKELGAESIKFTAMKGRPAVRLWSIPKTALLKFLEDPVSDTEVDFMEEMNGHPY